MHFSSVHQLHKKWEMFGFHIYICSTSSRPLIFGSKFLAKFSFDDDADADSDDGVDLGDGSDIS